MNDKQYLLTYQRIEGSLSFEWFDTEDELRSFVQINKPLIHQIFDAIKISNAENLDFKLS